MNYLNYPVRGKNSNIMMVDVMFLFAEKKNRKVSTPVQRCRYKKNKRNTLSTNILQRKAKEKNRRLISSNKK